MTKVRTASFLMGCISLATAAAGAFLIWLTLGLSSQKLPPLQPSKLAALVESTQSCETLKQVCSKWATIEDRRLDYMGFLTETNKGLFHTVMFGTVAWGLVTASGFFYLFAVSRKER
jgi:hypothetical protein